MTNFRKSVLLVLILMLLPIVQSCGGMKSLISPKSSDRTSAPVRDSSRTSIQSSTQTASLFKEYMEAGEYQKAIDIYNIEYQTHPHDQALVRGYVKSIENIKPVADKALDKEDYASAGRIYDVLLKNYSHFKGFENKLSFNNTHLNEKLSYCKKALFKQGFQEYRKGNLSGAIELWQDLLVIDPQNTDIKESLRTAELQQKKLREKE